MNTPSLKDVVRVRRTDDGRRIPQFPTLSACHQCGGYTGIYWEGKTQFPELACQVALIRYGYSHLGKFDIPPPDTKVCSCEAELEILREKAKKLPKQISDTGWQGRKAGRCITDYTRIIQYERDLTDDEYNTLCNFLRRDNCPGMNGVGGRHTAKGTYVFNSTWDSSD